MDAKTQLPMIDIWCQWDITFEEYADELRQYFATHPDTLQAIIAHMFTSRGMQPTKKWLHEWQEMKQAVPTPLLRPFLMKLAAKKEWYRRQASEHDMQALVALENSQHDASAAYTSNTLTIYGLSGHASRGLQRWRKDGGLWYERFGDFDAPRTRNIAKAACWALADFPDAQVRDLLLQIMQTKLRKPPLWTMTQWGDDLTLACLLQIKRLTPQHKIKTGIEEAFTTVAARRGLQVEQLKDRAILTHDLNAQGERTWSIGTDIIRLAISPAGRAVRRMQKGDGKWLRTPPPELLANHKQTWQAIAREAKLLSLTLSTQKKRLETAMRERRSWSWEEWQALFAHHPISGHLARRLVWAISDQDGTHITYAIYNAQGGWNTADGEAVQLDPAHRLHIIHPVEMRPEEHSRWQRYVVTHKIPQPFKQMFRPIYILTPAEEQTRTYSNRFASHIIPRQPFDKLHHAQFWETTFNACWHDFQQHNIRAYIWCKHDYRHNHGISLQQIAFYRTSHGTLWSRPRLDLDPACLPLSAVPPIVFSETMHDVDQYLVIASQGTDQHWDEDAPRDYYYHSNDSKPAQEREKILRQLIPLLDLGDAIQVEGRCAYINGQRCQYRVDLGNGTIYTAPTGRYLCIVPRYDAKNGQKLYLPFEESDPKTAEILSKILLLSHDETITDPTILRQLPMKRL